MALLVRPASPSDLSAIVTLMNAAFRGTPPNAGWNSEADFIAGDRTSEPLLSAEIAAKPNSVLLLARDNETSSLQGCVWLEPLSPHTWYLGSLTIDPPLQNSGLGRRLLQAAEQYAIERGAHTLQIKVVNVRDTLLAWYVRRGYRPTGHTLPFPYEDTRFGVPLRNDLAFVILEKRLAASISS